MHCECQLRARIREQLPIKIILTTWLAMWAMGEVISLLSLAPHAEWVLAHWTEVFPALVRGGRASFPISTDDRAGQLFVAGWLIPWTGAGLVVGGLLLRLLFGADSVALDRTELVVRRRLGPLSWSSRVPCESIRLLAVSPKTHALVAETEARRWTLSTFGTRAEREQALAELQSALGTQASQLPARSLVPAGWTTSVAADGWTELVRSRDVFRPAVMQGTWALALLIAAAAPEAISVVVPARPATDVRAVRRCDRGVLGLSDVGVHEPDPAPCPRARGDDRIPRHIRAATLLAPDT